jgi:polycystin 1L2
MVELFSLIPSILLVQFFRRIRSRQKQILPLHQALYKIKPHLQIQNTKQQKSGLTFPWWCLFIAYSLCVILVGISILFIIARGIEFGDLKTQQWLTSILSGFFSSIFLIQPVKILCLAIFFAFFCRKSDDDKEAHEHLDENPIDLDNNEEYIHSNQVGLFIYRSPIRTNRLNEAEVIYARNQRLKEIHMWSIIRETLTYLCFLSFLFIITYSNLNANSFLQVNHLRKYLLNTRQSDLDYTKISTINDYWNWLEESFVGNIHAQQWYNGDSPRNLSGFINDKSNRLIGWGTMRQLRIKSNLCSIENLNFTCEYDYSFSNEEKNSFEIGWGNETTIKSNLTIQQAFQYQSSDQLDTYVYTGDHGTYSGGGYVYEFRGRLIDMQSNLSELHQLGWIDRQTRAIIIQLSLYNPNADLFISLTFLTEFLSTGGIYPQSDFEPINFYGKFLFFLWLKKNTSLIYSSIYIDISINLYNNVYDIYHLFYDNRNSIIFSIKTKVFS